MARHTGWSIWSPLLLSMAVAAVPALGQEAGDAPLPAGVEERGFKIEGCDLGMSFDALKKCIGDKIDDRVDDVRDDLNEKVEAAEDARKKVESQLNAQLTAAKNQAKQVENGLRAQLAAAQQQAAKTQGQLESQLDTAKRQAEQSQQALRGQLDAANRELDRVRKQMQAQVDAARRELTETAEDARRRTAELDAQLAAAQRDADAARRQLQGELAARAQQAGKDIGQAVAAADELRRDAEAELARVTMDLQAQLAAAEQEVERLKQELEHSALLASLEFEKQALFAARALRAYLEPLAKCLASPKGQGFDLVATTQRFAADPARLPTALFDEVFGQVERDFANLMQEELAMLRAPGSAPKTAAQLYELSVAKFERLLSQQPGGACVVEVMGPQLRQASAQAAALQAESDRRVKALVEQHVLPVVQQGIAAAMSPIFTSLMQPRVASRAAMEPEDGIFLFDLIDPREIERIAVAVFMERFRAQMDKGTAAVDALACSLDQQASYDDLREDVHTALHPDTFSGDDLYVEIGMEIARSVGHNYIDSRKLGGGAMLIDQGVQVVDMGKSTVWNVVEVVCGFVFEVGGAVCGTVKQGFDLVWTQLVIPGTRIGITAATHLAHDLAIDVVKAEMLKAVPPGQPPGPFSQLVETFPGREVVIAFASSTLAKVDASFRGFNRSVRELADAQCELRDDAGLASIVESRR
jgi:hypothetical protein